MKRCKNITAWTDYPFTELGDIPHQRAPIRRVLVLSYDQNKYATIYVQGYGLITTVKCGYLYRNEARLSHGAISLNRRKLERMIPRTLELD